MARVDQEITDHLNTAVASLTKATNLFNSPMIAGSDLAVFCTLSGGPSPRMHLGPTYEKFPNVKVLVRSAPRGYGAGADLGQEVWTALHAQEIADYADVLVRESEPQYVGELKDKQHLWQMTVEVWQNATLT